MFYLVINIGKDTHLASLMDEKTKVISKFCSFSNTPDGVATLLEKIVPYASELEISMEATRHYWLSLYSFRVEQHFVVHVINSIQTDIWRKGTNIRKWKMDIIDSVLIADFIRYGYFFETSLANEDTMSFCNLLRFRNYLVCSIGILKERLSAFWIKTFLNTIMPSLIFFAKHQKNYFYN